MPRSKKTPPLTALLTVNSTKASVLVLGASGMLGHAVLRIFAAAERYRTFGTVRSRDSIQLLPPQVRESVISGVDADNMDSLASILGRLRPTVVINCIGVVKQLAYADEPLTAIPINALLPHRLAALCQVAGARLVHISTDCVFSGTKGMYREEDVPDALDLYGRSKHLGEVDYPHAVTLRTSIIGSELANPHGLVGWFLSQTASVRGFVNAVFSGLPTVELARVILDYVLPRQELRGVYHVSAEAISKYQLLRLVATEYGKEIDLIPDEKLVIDRSLDSSRFRKATGYAPPKWPELVRAMREFG